MNLFSRLDALLDGTEEPQQLSLCSRRREAERLVCKMESIFARARQMAVRHVAVERAAYHELNRQRQRAATNRVVLERLDEEQTHAKGVKTAVLKSLRELHQGLEHARLLRDAIDRWSDVNEEVGWNRYWRRFWRVYHRLCDLADEQPKQTQP